MRSSFLLSLVAAAPLFLAGCGSSAPAAQQPMPDAGDGKVHPATTGVAAQPAAACGDLTMAYEAQLHALSCVGTIPVCPGFLDTVVDATCAQYDEGTVSGCAAYYATATSCGDLTSFLSTCVVSALGCP